MHAEVAAAIDHLLLAVEQYGRPQQAEQPTPPPRRSGGSRGRARYLEELVEVACTECPDAYTSGSSRGDLASLSAKSIKQHDRLAHPDDPVDPALVAWAKDELRAGEWAAHAGRYFFVVPGRVPDD